VGLIASGSDTFWRSFAAHPREDLPKDDAPVFAARYEPPFAAMTEPSDFERRIAQATDLHRLFDCPNPVKYSDGSDAFCACEPEPPTPDSMPAWYRATFDVHAGDVIEMTMDAQGRLYPVAPEPARQPEPEPAELVDWALILNVLWIRLLANCGLARGVVDPACFVLPKRGPDRVDHARGIITRVG
jgi:hypothetical protein